jgi:hypothetical protein
MKSGRFHHTIKLDVELTGLELAVMQYHASQHYDHTCKRFFEHGNRGYGWVSEFRWKNDEKEPADAPSGTVVLEVSSRELDLCAKIIERLGYDETRAMMKDVFGIEVAADGEMAERATALRGNIREAFNRIQQEWKRLDEEATPAPKFDGELKCPSCGSESLEWQEYVLETRQLLGVKSGELGVDCASFKQVSECSKDECLACKDCYHEFKIPEGLAIDHTEEPEFEKKAG